MFHYNGHGVPKPTDNGELWVFNKDYTQYIPLSIYDLQQWLGSPSIYVFDCNCAGLIIKWFNKFVDQRQMERERSSTRTSPPSTGISGSSLGAAAQQEDHILLAACGEGETLPTNPDLPADIFTACLTTPIKMALKWFVSQTIISGVTLDLIDHIPGRLNDRRTPLGELNWIFTAVTDTIAWHVLPRPLFQKLFRQDLLVACLFRNFLLAERIMRSCRCTPISAPKLPPTYNHPMWQAWDLAADYCLAQLPKLIANPNIEFKHCTFFTEQLTAFEVWLEFGADGKKPPEQLPIVLQVLLSQQHRLRALVLLAKFLDLGPWAVNQGLSVGIFPYVLKLLQSPAVELREVLIFIWAKILAVDASCRTDLVKESGQTYFIQILNTPSIPAPQRTQTAFILSVICQNDGRVGLNGDGTSTGPGGPNPSSAASSPGVTLSHGGGLSAAHPIVVPSQGQTVCLPSKLIQTCLSQLNDPDPELRRWVVFCLAKLWENYEEAKDHAVNEKAHEKLCSLLTDPVPEVRAAAVYALGTFIANDGCIQRHPSRVDIEFNLGITLPVVNGDASPMVRKELAITLANFVTAFHDKFMEEARRQRLLEYSQLVRKSGIKHSASDSIPRSQTSASLTSSTSSHRNSDEKPVLTLNTDSTGRSVGDHRLSQQVTSTSAAAHVSASDRFRPSASTSSLGSLVQTHSSLGPGASQQFGHSHLSASTPGVAAGSRSAITVQQQAIELQHLLLALQGNLEEVSTDNPAVIEFIWKFVRSLSADPVQAVSQVAQHLSSSYKMMALQHHVQLLQAHGHDPSFLESLVASASSSSASSSSRKIESRGKSPSKRDLAASLGPSSAAGANSKLAQSTSSLTPAHSGRDNMSSGPPTPTKKSAGSSGSSSSRTLSGLSQLIPGNRKSTAAPLSNSGGTLGSSGEEHTISVSGSDEFPLLPLEMSSSLYDWACLSFCSPMMRKEEDETTPDYSERRWRQQRNEHLLLEARNMYADKQASMPRKLENEIAILETDFPMVSSLLFHSFEPIVVVADANRSISVWNWEEGHRMNKIDNRNAHNSHISSLTLINEHDMALIAVGADDGVVRIWGGIYNSSYRLVTAWRAFPDLVQMTRSRGAGLILEWQQQQDALFAAGNVSVIRQWDLNRELMTLDVATGTDSAVTCLTSDKHGSSGKVLYAGFADGLVRVYDTRAATSQQCVQTFSDLKGSPVVSISRPRCTDFLVAGATSGHVKFWDGKKSDANQGIASSTSSGAIMQALATHDQAPVIATGSSDQRIRVMNYRGEEISLIRYHDGFLGQRIGPVSSLSFHSCHNLLGAGFQDTLVSIYAGETFKAVST